MGNDILDRVKQWFLDLNSVRVEVSSSMCQLGREGQAQSESSFYCDYFTCLFSFIFASFPSTFHLWSAFYLYIIMWNCFPFSYFIITNYQSVCKVFRGEICVIRAAESCSWSYGWSFIWVEKYSITSVLLRLGLSLLYWLDFSKEETWIVQKTECGCVTCRRRRRRSCCDEEENSLLFLILARWMRLVTCFIIAFSVVSQRRCWQFF